MLEGNVIDTLSLSDRYAGIDELGNVTYFNGERKQQAYQSQAVRDMGLYSFNANLVGAKRFFLQHMARHDKIVYGNTIYQYAKKGLYQDVVYFDYKNYYVKIFEQICSHIDESYFGKEVSGIVTKKTYLKQLKDNGVPFSKEALKKPLVLIDDIAEHSIKLDAGNDKTEILKMINGLSNANFYDEADKRVAKITRNAIAFGFGFQQKHAKINNISALVMFFAKDLLKKTIEQLLSITGEQTIFSHTDSFMLPHLNTKDLDEAVRTACGLVDAEYFGNTEVLSMGLNNISIKGKFEELLVISPYAYVASTVAPRGKRDIQLRIAGLHTTSMCGLGIDKKGTDIQEFLNDHMQELFSWSPIKDEDKEYLYSILKYRLAPEFEESLKTMWQDNNKKLYEKAVIISKTIKHLNYLKARK